VYNNIIYIEDDERKVGGIKGEKGTSSNIGTYDRVDGRLARGRDICRISGIYTYTHIYIYIYYTHRSVVHLNHRRDIVVRPDNILHTRCV